MLLLVLAWGCSAADNDSANGPSGTAGSGVTEGGNDEATIRLDGSKTDDAGPDLNPLCGKLPSSTCVPDDPSACATYAPPLAPDSEGGAFGIDAAGAGGASGTAGEGGTGGMDANEGGASGSAGEAGMGGQAGGSSPQSPPSTFSCQVRRTNADDVVSQCAIAGPGGVGSPCLSSADCQGGDSKGRGALGCVGDSSSGLCLPYCCQGTDTCGVGTFCAERPMRDATTRAGEQLSIPVCVPAENCDLSTPYPCPEGTECACKSGTACLVVRADGTTTCAAPGAGKVGEACPCAWGHVCSAVTNQCLKLCYTRGTNDCGTGKCQSASELPDGWGVCVGG